ncbi:MAG: glycosyltransferase [Acidithiobacillus sp.]|nr:glycosyltransferase [Acidithiobacillus sp.]
MTLKAIWCSWINPFRKYPDGGSEDIRRRIIVASRFFSSIDLYAVDRAESLECFVDVPENVRLHLYPRHLDIRLSSCVQPLPSILRYNQQLVCDLKSKLSYLDVLLPPVIILEGLQLSGLWLDIRCTIDRRSICILRMHNLESDYHRSVSTESKWLRKLGHRLAAYQYRNAEANLLRDFDFIYAVSESEMDVVQKQYTDICDRLRWVPPIPDGRVLPPAILDENGLFIISYFGDLTLPNNFGGFNWFCSKILPLLSGTQFRVHVAGKGSEYFDRYRGVKVFGFVDSIEHFISQSHLIVAPILSGGGVKIKVLDTITTGKPLLTSSKGCEGLPYEIIGKMNIADSEREWVDEIMRISSSYLQACVNTAELRQLVLCRFGEQQFLDGLLMDVRYKYNNGSFSINGDR